MNLHDFHQFEPLNRLKEQMGLPRDHYGAFPRTSSYRPTERTESLDPAKSPAISLET